MSDNSLNTLLILAAYSAGAIVATIFFNQIEAVVDYILDKLRR